MTENKKNKQVKTKEGSVPSETSAPETATPAGKKTPRARKVFVLIVIFIALLLMAIIACGTYLYKEQQILNTQNKHNITQLSTQLSEQQKSQKQQLQKAQLLQANLKTQLEEVRQQLQKVKNASKLYKTDMQALQRRFTETKVRQPNDWILSEVEYLVTLAGRKIWLERDIPTAITILVAADQRVMELSDSSLSVLRSALLEDINELEELPKRDPDGVVLALSSLERRIDKLVAISGKAAGASVVKDSEVSSDIHDWQENLTKSWSDFVNSFIVINKRDTKLQVQLSPQQSWYLKEKLRNDLAKAEFAVYREQQDIYNIALHSAVDLLKNYYDLGDNATNHFYKSVQRLSKRKISINYPDQLKSAPLLDRIIKQRVKKSLASSRVQQE